MSWAVLHTYKLYGVFGTAKCILLIEVSSFPDQGALVYNISPRLYIRKPIRDLRPFYMRRAYSMTTCNCPSQGVLLKAEMY